LNCGNRLGALQAHNDNASRREIIANCQNRSVPLRSQTVHSAVSKIQLRAMAHALPNRKNAVMALFACG